MSASYPGPAGGRTGRPSVSAGTLWAGGVATATVAAFGYAVGVVIARGVFDIPVLAPERAGVTGDASTLRYAAGAFIAAIVATAVLHLLLLVTPRPLKFFGWIVGLATVLVTVLPFTSRAGLDAKIATAVINLVVGVMIGTLLRSVATRSLRPERGRPPYAAPGVMADWETEEFRIMPPGYNDGRGYSSPRAPDTRPAPPNDLYGN